ncbi:UDP-3-O-(3-hydroxymyristoyl)glucosamine N-acyltransferase [Marinomonas mediterranea]|jgi:UDP-3-O-[3-hydroxymyristoyl] glucosamine N-acyltransferase (EC 2.3.1.-)|uniref:UDP-3-O-acylglucosamine N-acyltransferase n=1 Tax=Marinomonas mediterranea (strain ATCC 700492 / JCM 21426 / NBRC 103028 / MMB-1) TaxID=717774 RepID=F2JU08_MARM1|nr:UDP-3-O-(3-hydroxymyristoyl)glucosamine N-acyltransferase [Marinomonas mediterranea]ADZ90429.1 UDP-3-O-(3-hydroxymyristoyl) glucosamine N-acyltransferase [Marinomonas mediterranea MMB-1]WCN12537.1 UDP-3-O-(3-hydroxymyristoyl)glucosamine N-acyltransferase [Marinomonas mediterranea]WCN16608.1 UDP-3-O-(3-hydroxymyristoyl)glucosamine N-acyltransferase [Marinomonas mediterranea MMB-1]
MSYRLGELAELVCGEVVGDPNYLIHSLSTLEAASSGQLSFLANPKYANKLNSTKAGAVLVKDAFLATNLDNAIVVGSPYLALATLTKKFEGDVSTFSTSDLNTVSKEAVIADSAVIGEGCVIEPNVVVGEHAVIKNNCYLGAGTVVSRNVSIGEGTHTYPNVTFYHGVKVGKHCIIHSGVVIGSDGFGFAPSKEGWVKFHQLGSVIIKDNVEIGANTTIDRGALENTEIGHGVKIDNQVQIAHNVVIGDNSAIAGCAAVAGSTSIGKNCTIAGGVGIIGHLTITDNVHVTAMTLVSKSILKSGSYSSGTGVDSTDKWRRSAARFRRIDDMAKQISELEKQVKKLLTEG